MQLTSFFGFRSRILIFVLLSFLCAIFSNYVFFGLFGCIVSVTPKGTCCPPLTSFSGIRSLRRINLPFARFRFLLPDSAAGAFFLFFGVFTFVLY